MKSSEKLKEIAEETVVLTREEYEALVDEHPDGEPPNAKIILTRDEYEALIEEILDLRAIITCYETKNEPGRPWEEVKKELELNVQNNNST